MSNKLTKINYKKPLVFKYKNLNINLEFKQLVSIFLLLLLVTYFGVEFYIILDEKPKNYNVYPHVPFGFTTFASNQNNTLYLCIDKKELNDTSVINSCFNQSDFRYVSNDLIEKFSRDLLREKPHEPFTLRIKNDNSKIGLFIYDLIYKKKKYYYKKIANSKLAYWLYKLFGDGFWVKQGEFLISRNDLVYSSNIEVFSSKKNCMWVCKEKENVKNLKFSMPKLYNIIIKDGRLVDPTIQLIQDYLRYAVPKNYNDNKSPDFFRVRKYFETKVSPFSSLSCSNKNSQFALKVSGKKHHNGEVFLAKKVFDRESDGYAKAFEINKKEDFGEGIESEVVYYDNNEFTLSVNINPKSHGKVLYYLVNSIINEETSVTTAQPLFWTAHDFIGPSLRMDYNIYDTRYVTDDDGFYLGKATIEVGTWEGPYKPLTVRLSGDIEQLYIGGRKFTFDPKKNPQEIFRRFFINDHIGYNRIEVKAIDGDGNEKISYWGFEAVRVEY